jgi:hypothetical protein
MLLGSQTQRVPLVASNKNESFAVIKCSKHKLRPKKRLDGPASFNTNPFSDKKMA